MVGRIIDFHGFLKQVVKIASFSSRDQYGSPTYGADREYKARVGHVDRIIKGADGSDIIVSSVVWLGSAVEVSTVDRITMPGGQTPPILSVDEFWDDYAQHHTRLMLG